MEILGRGLGAEIFHDLPRAPVWRENMLGYLSTDIICSEKRTVLRERANFRSGDKFRPIACE